MLNRLITRLAVALLTAVAAVGTATTAASAAEATSARTPAPATASDDRCSTGRWTFSGGWAFCPPENPASQYRVAIHCVPLNPFDDYWRYGPWRSTGLSNKYCDSGSHWAKDINLQTITPV
jgi:hypothetical protein